MADLPISRQPAEAHSSCSAIQQAPACRPVTIIILTWNGVAYTNRCLATLRANTRFSEYDVIVADNGSTDGTLEYLQSQDLLKTIANGRNLGFAKANNRAIEVADPNSDIVLLNNDTEVYQPDWLTRLQATAYSSSD